jgi:hypothetical protein
MLREVVLLVALCNCGNAAAAPTVFVTEALDEDGVISIAVVVDGSRVAAYACSGDVKSDPYPGWFVGDVRDGAFDLVQGGWSLVGQVTANGATGTIVDPSGSAVPWASAPASGSSGVYTDDSGCAGVIVLDRGSGAPTVRGAWCNVLQVTPVLPVEVVDDEIAVDVATLHPFRVWARRVRSARR